MTYDLTGLLVEALGSKTAQSSIQWLVWTASLAYTDKEKCEHLPL